MTQVLQFVGLLVGVVYLLSGSFVARPLRALVRRVGILGVLIYCPVCLSFWVGLGMQWLGFMPLTWMHQAWLRYPVTGLIAMGVTVVVSHFADLVELSEIQEWSEETAHQALLDRAAALEESQRGTSKKN